MIFLNDVLFLGQCLAFSNVFVGVIFFQLKGALAAAEEARGDLEDRLAEMKDKLREARARAEDAVSDHVTILYGHLMWLHVTI